MKDENLNVFDSEYLKMYKMMQKITGLWPYDCWIKKYILRFVYTLIFFLSGVPHINAIRMWCGVSVPICSENIAASVFVSGVTAKYLAIIVTEKKISMVFKSIAENWASTEDPEEKSILKKYALIGRHNSLVYTAILITSGIMISQSCLIPIVLDFVIPLNESRKKMKLLNAEYFVNADEFFWEIYFSYLLIVTVYFLIISSVGTSYVAAVHQSMGMFNIVKHRLKMATISSHKGNDLVLEKIISAIHMHQQSLKFINLLEATFANVFIVLVGFVVVFLSVGVISAIENISNIQYMIRNCFFIVGVTLYLFYVSWQGQSVIDESAEIHSAIYASIWYSMPIRAKKLILVMMMRSLQPCCLTAAGLYTVNFENFGKIVKSCVSYMTVFASFRN